MRSDISGTDRVLATRATLGILMLLVPLGLTGCSGFAPFGPPPPPPPEIEPLIQGSAAQLAALDLVEVDAGSAELRINTDPGVEFEEVARSDDRLVLEAKNVELDSAVRSLVPNDGLVARVDVSSLFRDGLPMARIEVVSRHDAAFNLVPGGSEAGVRDRGLRIFMASKLADSQMASAPADHGRTFSEDHGEAEGRVVASAIPLAPSSASSIEPAFTVSQVVAKPVAESHREVAPASREETVIQSVEAPTVETVGYRKNSAVLAVGQEPSGREVESPDLPLSELSPAAAMRAAASVVPGTPSAPTVSEPLSSRAAKRVEALELAPLGADAIYRVQGDGQFVYRTFMLPDPLRFVIDLEGVIEAAPEDVLPSNRGAVERVRIGQFQRTPEPVARVVFDLRQPGVPLIQRDSTGISIRFVPQPDEPLSQAAVETAPAPTPEAEPASEPEFVAAEFDSPQPSAPDVAAETVAREEVRPQVPERVEEPEALLSTPVAEQRVANADPEPTSLDREPVVVDSPEGFRVIRRHAEALGRRDLTSLLADVAEGVEWFTVVGSDTVLVSRGRDGFLAAMKDRFAHEDARIEIGEIIDNGRFVTLREKRVWSNSAGIETVSNTLSVFELDNGKIVRFWSYPGQ